MGRTSVPRGTDSRRTTAFPPERKLVLDTLALGRAKPMMHAFLEVDVTVARLKIQAHRERTGETLSFTAFVLACLGKAVAKHPEVHALRDWRGRVVCFEDVDATAIVEVDVEGRPFALAHVLRSLNRRTPLEIHQEIREVKAKGMGTLPAAVRLGSHLALAAPNWLRRCVIAAALKSPSFAKRHTGTLLVTSVGMFGRGAGWGMSAPGIHNLSVVIGGIATRPSADPAQPAPREVVCLTVSANHELVDGAPMARFTRTLTGLMEGAEGL